MRDEQDSGVHPPTKILALLGNKHLVFSIIAQFFYVGAQVGTWSYFIQYIQAYTGQPDKTAGYLLTGTLAMFAVGRFASAAIMKYLQPATLMGCYCLVNIVLVGIAVFHPGWGGVWTLFITSFFMSLMYPTIFALGLRGMGGDSKVGGSLIVMAIIGGAVLTPLMGIVADSTNSIACAYLVPLFGYICISLYSFFGQRLPSTKAA
jgi:FHS family L-fucose permease-like MFS transporter